MKIILDINAQLNSIVWGPYMLALLVGTGIYLTIRTKFFQVAKFGFAMRSTLGKLLRRQGDKADETNISPFQAVSTALASTVGTGNIVGVATAITAGGPGAVFWMWLSAFFGMMTKFGEIVLAIKFREKNAKGQNVGGPMYYIKNGLNWGWLATIFAVLATLASFGIGNISQVSSIATAFETSFGWDPLVVGIVLAAVTATVIIGGIKSIARVTEKLVPFMAIFYILLSLVLLVVNANQIIPTLGLIFYAAFNPQAAVGGVAGYTIMMAIQKGVARGVFSNEAGLGSAPIAHSASNTKEPVEQGMWGVFEVFVDTIIICTLTAMVVLTTGIWTDGVGENPKYEGAALTIAAFNHGLPGQWGGWGLTIGLALFAFSTILGWSYYGEKSLEYLFRGSDRASRIAVMAYRIVFSLVCVLGAYAGSNAGIKFVWDISDTLNGMMAIPNLIGLLALSGVIFAETKSYLERKGPNVTRRGDTGAVDAEDAPDKLDPAEG
ncbi:MAG: sodium:alanine symporter family protein [Mobiluncus sp.]|uniref:alanine/glycine:cation symporter family protein n=1 Tax=Mobiluncus sp. TaxID=47293 RepID=UPI00258B86A1|nr:sodium:alanine symporter family protein [Mobiluncus sp.]MCI6584188.1 sodium:alanine symporter family protein [Mobiluncus sp.]